MISESEARKRILEHIHVAPTRTASLEDALDCFAAEDYFARVPLPNFDNSAMDGYAAIATDCRAGKRLRIIGEQPAGLDRQLRVSSGEAVRIFTGAPIPGGADAVIMQEDVARQGEEIVVNVDVESGEFVRRRGCDLSEGQKILAAGERVRAAMLGLLASQGFDKIRVGGKVDTAIISNGDELARQGRKLRPGQIYDSNAVLLQALLQRCGATVASVQHCGDKADSLGKAVAQAARHQILIITGGVSVGEHDLVQSVLRSLGAKIEIWRVAIKPGKPFLFGQIKQSQSSPPAYGVLRRGKQSSPNPTPLPSPQSSPSGRGGPASAQLRLGKRGAAGEGGIPTETHCFVFGLPGNPVSAFVTFLQFVRPAILKMMGATNLHLVKLPAKLAIDVRNDSDRPHYIRGKLEHGKFAPVGRQESHALFGLSQSNALLRVDLGEGFRHGEIVEVETWD